MIVAEPPTVGPLYTLDTIPVAEVTVAIVVFPLLHEPPPTALLNVIVALRAHKDVGPVIGSSGFTVTVVVAKQPPAIEYVIGAVPGATPYTTPEVRPIVAIPVALLTHVPPGALLLNVVVLPWHSVVTPDIG